MRIVLDRRKLIYLIMILVLLAIPVYSYRTIIISALKLNGQTSNYYVNTTWSDCASGNYVYGVSGASGVLECRPDIDTDTNASTACSLGEHLDGSNACLNTNTTIDNRIASTTYNATDIATDAGVLDAGDVESTWLAKESPIDSYNVSEAAGANPLVIVVNYTGVNSFDFIDMREWYSAGFGHEIAIGLWDYDSNSWEEEYGEITDMDDFAFSTIPVRDPASHVGPTGNVSLRFRHVQSGSPAHDFFLDYAVLIEGFSGTTNIDHDGLSGRDDKVNHPWAFPTDASRNISASVNITGGLNATGSLNSTYGTILTLDGTTVRFTNLNATGNLNVTFGTVSTLDGVTARYTNLNATANANVTFATIGTLDVNQATVTGNVSVTTGNVSFTDNMRIYFGTGDDVCMYYNSTDFIIESSC